MLSRTLVFAAAFLLVLGMGIYRKNLWQIYPLLFILCLLYAYRIQGVCDCMDRGWSAEECWRDPNPPAYKH